MRVLHFTGDTVLKHTDSLFATGKMAVNLCSVYYFEILYTRYEFYDIVADWTLLQHKCKDYSILVSDSVKISSKLHTNPCN